MKAGELIDSLLRYHKWKESVPGYVENDSPLFSYRNKSGRHCGRAADAPYSCSSLFLARLIIKREQEYYSRLKNRTYDNNWGGKSGARNAWIASMKEYGNAFHTVRDGLLTLESAFFELCGGFVKNEQENEIPLDNIKLSGRELLDDDAHRVEIELESIGQEIKGLWNSEGSRNIFLEMMKNTTSVGFVALGLDLICRNCQGYLDATKPATTTRNSYEAARASFDQGLYATASGRVTRSSLNYEQQQLNQEVESSSRRMNSWQQQNSYN